MSAKVRRILPRRTNLLFLGFEGGRLLKRGKHSKKLWKTINVLAQRYVSTQRKHRRYVGTHECPVVGIFIMCSTIHGCAKPKTANPPEQRVQLQCLHPSASHEPMPRLHTPIFGNMGIHKQIMLTRNLQNQFRKTQDPPPSIRCVVAGAVMGGEILEPVGQREIQIVRATIPPERRIDGWNRTYLRQTKKIPLLLLSLSNFLLGFVVVFPA